MPVRRSVIAASLMALLVVTSGCGDSTTSAAPGARVPGSVVPVTPRGVVPGTVGPAAATPSVTRLAPCKVRPRLTFEDRGPYAVTVCVRAPRPVTVQLQHPDEWAFRQPEVRGDAVAVRVSETETADLELVLTAVRPGVVTVHVPVVSSSPAGGVRAWDITVRSL